MNSDNPFVNRNNSSPMIIDIGDDDYVTLYGYNIESKDLNLEYRYTGNKSHAKVEQILNGLVIEAFEKAMKEL
jgi:hypothetical protein